MRWPAPARRNAKLLAILLSVVCSLVLFIAPAVAHAAGATPGTTGASAAQSATTASAAPATGGAAAATGTTVSTAATNSSPASSVAPFAPATTAPPTSSTQTGPTTVIPPASGIVAPPTGFAPLNPGWVVDSMGVQIWPEYDQEAVLVIMTLTLPADVQLPATFKFTVPHAAQIAGIGEVDPNGNFKYNYEGTYPPVQAGTDWDTVTIQVKNYKLIQIDYYYDPTIASGAGPRSFPVLFQAPTDVTSLNLHIQQPSRATDFKVQPDMQGTGKAGDGFTYAVSSFSNVKAGSTLGQTVSYSKPDANPSVVNGQVTGSKLNTTTVLIAVVVIVVVFLAAFIAYLFYRSAGQNRRGDRRPRPQRAGAVRGAGPNRPKTSTKASTGSRANAATKVSAPKGGGFAGTKGGVPAGTKASTVAAGQEPADIEPSHRDEGEATAPAQGMRYCEACGEELTGKARFCPNCGEAVDS